MKKYRILEVVDTGGLALYYIQKRHFLFFWCNVEKFNLGGRHHLCFYDLDDARKELAKLEKQLRNSQVKSKKVVK